MESALLVYAYALQILGFKEAHFQVQKANERVWRFHERLGASRTHENEHEYQYRMSHEAILDAMSKYARYSSLQINVEP